MSRFTEDNTQDTDFKVLRPKESELNSDLSHTGHKRAIRWGIGGVCFLLIMVFFLLRTHKEGVIEPESNAGNYLYEPEILSDKDTKPVEELISAVCDTIGLSSFTEHTTRTINDIALDIYIPHGANAELAIGTPNISDSTIIFAAQAADIRADNKKIVGAFVLKGEPLAWGLSKKGYVAIIEGNLTIGLADNSPLFEEATEKEGYFFRQYPLVSNGTAIDNEPKGKSVRKAICKRNAETMIIMSKERESFHDFAQALADFGVDNAVYLVGSENAYGFYRTIDGRTIQFANKPRISHKYDNYIIWRR